MVLILCLTGMAVAGLAGLHSAKDSLNTLYQENVVKTRVATYLVAYLDDAAQVVLESLLAEGPVDRRRLTNELASTLTPSIDVGIADLIRSSASHADEARVTLRIAAEWADSAGCGTTNRPRTTPKPFPLRRRSSRTRWTW